MKRGREWVETLAKYVAGVHWYTQWKENKEEKQQGKEST
jgi:hypothetical protein